MKRGLGLVLYGTEGIGKTGTALQFPKPLDCRSLGETGFEDLEDIGEVPEGCTNRNITNWSSLLGDIENSTAASYVIDSLSGLQELCFQHVIDTEFGGDVKKFTAYYTGPRQNAPIHMKELLHELTLLRGKGTNVILIGHAQTDMEPNALGDDYPSHVVDMDKGIRAPVLKWAQAILFMTLFIDLQDRKAKDETTRWFEEMGSGAEYRPNVPHVHQSHIRHHAIKRLLPQFAQSHLIRRVHHVVIDRHPVGRAMLLRPFDKRRRKIECCDVHA